MPTRPRKHGPCRLAAYLRIHTTVIAKFQDDGFLGFDTTKFFPRGKIASIEGTLGCLGHIVIRVMKILEFVDDDPTDPLIQTVAYSYNTSLHNRGNIFRYDNMHAGCLHDGHDDEHHKHIFDWTTGDKDRNSPIWIGADEWPTLREVIEEARVWHSEHFNELPNSDGFPPVPTEFGR